MNKEPEKLKGEYVFCSNPERLNFAFNYLVDIILAKLNVKEENNENQK